VRGIFFSFLIFILCLTNFSFAQTNEIWGQVISCEDNLAVIESNNDIQASIGNKVQIIDPSNKSVIAVGTVTQISKNICQAKLNNYYFKAGDLAKIYATTTVSETSIYCAPQVIIPLESLSSQENNNEINLQNNPKGEPGAVVFSLPGANSISQKDPAKPLSTFMELNSKPPVLKLTPGSEYLIRITGKSAKPLITVLHAYGRDNIITQLDMVWPWPQPQQYNKIFMLNAPGSSFIISGALDDNTANTFEEALAVYDQEATKQKQNLSSAAELFLKSVENMPIQSDAYLFLGLIYAKCQEQRRDLAYQYFQYHCNFQTERTVYSFLNLARLDLLNGNTGKAITHYKSALSQDSELAKLLEQRPTNPPVSSATIADQARMMLWYENKGPAYFSKAVVILQDLEKYLIQKNNLNSKYLIQEYL